MAVLDSLISKPELKPSCAYPMKAPVAFIYFTKVLETGHEDKLVLLDDYILSVQHYAKLTIVKQLA